MDTFFQVLKFNPYHDEKGRFTTKDRNSTGETGEFAGLDKRLVDYKPDRSLSDPSQVANITDVLPNVSYTAYSKTPFLAEMHRHMGIDDPMKVPVSEYMDARKKMFKNQPIVEADLDSVVVTQKVINRAEVDRWLASDAPADASNMPIQTVRYKNQTYIMNGHHRAVATIKRGRRTLLAHELNLDGPVKKVDLYAIFKREYHRHPAGAPNSQGGQFAPKGKGDSSGVEFFAKEDYELPTVVTQPVNEEDQLYGMAAEGLQQFRQWLNEGNGVANQQLGARTMGLPPEEVADWGGGAMLFIAPLKGKARAKEKIDSEDHGRWDTLTDIVRGTVAFNTLDELRTAVSTLKTAGMVLAKAPKNRVKNPLPSDYRDVLMNIRMPNGLVAELQLHLKKMLKAKNEGHHFYVKEREVFARNAKGGVVKPRDQWSPEDVRVADEAFAKQKSIYSEAWLDITGEKEVARVGKAESEWDYWDSGTGHFRTKRAWEQDPTVYVWRFGQWEPSKTVLYCDLRSSGSYSQMPESDLPEEIRKTEEVSKNIGLGYGRKRKK